MSKIVYNSKEITIFWDKMSKLYQKNLELSLLPHYINLISLLGIQNLNKDNKILELSVGNGLGFSLLKNFTNSKLYGGDISKEMLKLAKQRIKNFDDIELMELNNEDLSKFNNNYFDCVFSNYSLHLVENPEKMLLETKRVLNKNCYAGFTIPGRSENSFHFSLIPKLLKKNNIVIPNIRSFHHISEKDKLYKLLKLAGFNVIYLDYSESILDYKCAEDLLFLFDTPFYKELFEKENPEKFKSIVDEFINEVNNHLKENKRMKHEGLFCIVSH